MLSTLLALGCTPEQQPNAHPRPTSPSRPELEFTAAGVAVEVSRTIRLDPGQFIDGNWAGAALRGTTVEANGVAAADGEVLALHIGWNPLTVRRRGCLPTTVPVRADPGVDFVVVPFPICDHPLDVRALPDGTLLDRREFTLGQLRELQSLGLLPNVAAASDADDVPARWITRDEAQAACGFFGGGLMSRAQWTAGGGTGLAHLSAEGPAGAGVVSHAPSIGPLGHLDLDGNVAEWAFPESDRGGFVVGGSWLRAGTAWAVPTTARADEIGFRCAYAPGERLPR